MKFTTRKNFGAFTLLQMLLVIAVIALLAAIALPQVRGADLFTLTSVKAFSNAPSFIMPSAVSNATVTANSYRSNMIPVRPGKGLGLVINFTRGSNATAATAATVANYFGVICNRTNVSTFTNFTWTVSVPPIAAGVIAFTNIPAVLVDNADGVIWYSSQSTDTNTLTGFKLLGQQAN